MRTYPFCLYGLLLFSFPFGVFGNFQWKLKVWTIENYFQGKKKKVKYQVYFYNFIHTLCVYVNCTYPSIRKYHSQQGLILQQDHTGFVIKDCGLCCFIPLLPCINLYPTDFMTELTCFMLTTELGQSHSYCREENYQSLQLFNSLAKESHNLPLIDAKK